MHCPGDENIIPIYRPDESTPVNVTSVSTSTANVANIKDTQVSVAAPKTDRGTAMTSEEQRRLIREEKERDY